MPNPQEVLDDLKEMNFPKPANMKETMDARPSHYHDQPYDVAAIQEAVLKNIGSWVKPGDVGYVDAMMNSNAIKAMWVSFAVKHILRAGLKDDVDCELKKAENYLHRARTGEWLEK